MDRFEHRKKEIRLKLTDRDGKPLSRAKVQVDQTSHRFLFGCGAFDTLEIVNPKSEESRAFYEDRMEKFLQLFNYGTLPFYLGRYEPVEGKPMQEETVSAAKWLVARGVTVKGHPLCWHTACADWLMDYPNEVIFEKQLARIRRDVKAFKGVIDMWDVINEVVIMPEFDKYDNAITRICRQYGRMELVKEVFEAAKEENPGATLLINDFNTTNAYEILVEGLLYAGVPITAIGIQSHQHQGYWGLEKLHTVLDRFSQFGLPIHFTENTLISGELMPPEIVDLNDYQVPVWPSTPEYEERQAREASEMYTELFAHPLVEAITTWDLTDGKWLGAPSGVMTAKNEPKPVFHALKKLIHGDWETHTAFETDEDGFVTLYGFMGDYELKTEKGSAKISLQKECPEALSVVMEQ